LLSQFQTQYDTFIIVIATEITKQVRLNNNFVYPSLAYHFCN